MAMDNKASLHPREGSLEPGRKEDFHLRKVKFYMKPPINLLITLFMVLVMLLVSCERAAIPSGQLPPFQTRTPSATETLTPTATETGTPTPLPNYDPIDFRKSNVVYCTMAGDEQLADIYTPPHALNPAPLLIYIHGGGLQHGDKRTGSGIVELPALFNAGFVIASINYRLAPEFPMPAMVEDSKCAVRFFRANATRFNIDPDRIGVWGSSAGGYLSAMLGTSGETTQFDVGDYLGTSSRVQAVVDMFGPTDFVTMSLEAESAKHLEFNDLVFSTSDLTNPIFTQSSAVTYVSPDDPPFLILHGDMDKDIPVAQAYELYNLLKAAGADAQLVVVAGGGHGLRNPGEVPSEQEITRLIVDFFIKELWPK